MALKDDLNAIKKDLGAEEQLIENFIKGERLIKKYKIYIIILFILIAGYFIYDFIDTKITANNTRTNNELFTSLMQNPNNTSKINALKEQSPNLYALFLLSQFKSQPEFAQDLSASNKLKTDPLLKEIILLNEGKQSQIFLKQYDKIMQAYELLQENKIQEASVLLNQIPIDSTFSAWVKNFKHYKGIQ